ncbi:FMN-dependent NADH-azoreductase [Chlorogloea sp. CCALA 695]|uniref:FMN-dependent NADH-azoreductase n=1 Tax=Chlorogloea sp. CCALA 695 TaxID=2107693 RepID=UPI000D07A06B|nr:FMN-dependent NADH-azoreductase [Chlorogloea sp. CCALA 695]PSB34572.1 FMN-dependent NADH-azoreductase [Chlorogloea sp. CCALA 695]
MAHILHIDSSPRAERSHSRSLTHRFVTDWKNAHPQDTVTYRDLGHQPVPHVDEPWIAAAYSAPETHTPELQKAISTSNTLIDELLAADRYVFGIPMYNLNIPSTFKAYIDQIVRVGRTFAINEQGYQGLVSGKKMLVITSSGGSFRPGTPMGGYNFQEPFLKAIFGFIGITDITFINADNLDSGGDEGRKESLTEASNAISQAIANW